MNETNNVNNTNTNQNKGPEKKFRVGTISATVWKNTTEKDGKVSEYKTVTLQRSYQDDKGNWQKTESLRSSDLPKATLVMNKAYEYIMLKEQ